MKLIFYLQINKKVFSKFVVSSSLCVGRHAEIVQNNKFAMSLLHLKKNMKDDVDFLPADKHERFIQIDTIILGVWRQACPYYKIYRFDVSL